MTNSYIFCYLWFLCPCTIPAQRELCAVLEGFFVALCPDTKKIFKWWQKAGVEVGAFCPSFPSDHYREIYENLYGNRLLEYSPTRLQDPSLLCEGN